LPFANFVINNGLQEFATTFYEKYFAQNIFCRKFCKK